MNDGCKARLAHDNELHLHRHACHLPAGFGTTAANVRAFLHLRIVGKLLTALGAARTRLCAHAAHARMEGGLPQHEIRAGDADLGTVAQEA